MRRETCGIMFCTVMYMHQGRHIWLPIRFRGRLQCTEYFEQCSIEALALAIFHRVVRGGTALLTSTQETQFLYYLALKVPALITVQTSWKTAMHNEVIVQDLGSGLGCLVPGGVSLGVFCKVVSHHQNVLITSLSIGSSSIHNLCQRYCKCCARDENPTLCWWHSIFYSWKRCRYDI